MKRHLLILALLLLPVTLAQVSQTGEDFEDDTVGAVVNGVNPNADWYSIERVFGGGATAELCATSTTGPRHTRIANSGTFASSMDGNFLRMLTSGSGSNAVYCNLRFHITPPNDIAFFSFDYTRNACSNIGDTVGLFDFRFRNAVGAQFAHVRTFCGGDGSWRIFANPTSAFGTDGEPRICNNIHPGSQSRRISFLFDYAAQTYTTSVDLAGCEAKTVAFQNAALEMGRFETTDASGANRNGGWGIDNINIDLAVPPEPSTEEFEAGLRGTIISLGFVTIESQMLFALILIGFAVILGAFLTSIMGEGPGRNWIVYGLSTFAGVFCIYFLIMEFWVFTLALVLSTAIMRGGAGFANSIKALTPDISSILSPRPQPTTATPPDQTKIDEALDKFEQGRIFSGETHPVEASEPEPTPVSDGDES